MIEKLMVSSITEIFIDKKHLKNIQNNLEGSVPSVYICPCGGRGGVDGGGGVGTDSTAATGD